MYIYRLQEKCRIMFSIIGCHIHMYMDMDMYMHGHGHMYNYILYWVEEIVFYQEGLFWGWVVLCTSWCIQLAGCNFISFCSHFVCAVSRNEFMPVYERSKKTIDLSTMIRMAREFRHSVFWGDWS